MVSELSAPRRRLIGAFGEGYAKFFFCSPGVLVSGRGRQIPKRRSAPGVPGTIRPPQGSCWTPYPGVQIAGPALGSGRRPDGPEAEAVRCADLSQLGWLAGAGRRLGGGWCRAGSEALPRRLVRTRSGSGRSAPIFSQCSALL